MESFLVFFILLVIVLFLLFLLLSCVHVAILTLE